MTVDAVYSSSTQPCGTAVYLHTHGIMIKCTGTSVLLVLAARFFFSSSRTNVGCELVCSVTLFPPLIPERRGITHQTEYCYNCCYCCCCCCACVCFMCILRPCFCLRHINLFYPSCCCCTAVFDCWPCVFGRHIIASRRTFVRYSCILYSGSAQQRRQYVTAVLLLYTAVHGVTLLLHASASTHTLQYLLCVSFDSRQQCNILFRIMK